MRFQVLLYGSTDRVLYYIGGLPYYHFYFIDRAATRTTYFRFQHLEWGPVASDPLRICIIMRIHLLYYLGQSSY